MKRQRYAVNRLSMGGPIYLGDVLATDRDHARRLGVEQFGSMGGHVEAHRTTERSPASSQLLERAVKATERRRNRPAHGYGRAFQKPMTHGGNAA